jgi:Fe-S oxidoreductase
MKNIVPRGYMLLKDSIVRADNLFGFPSKVKGKWAEGLNLPRKGERLFFAGCGYQFMSYAEPLLEKIKSMENKGVNVDRALSFTMGLRKLGLNIPALLSKVSLGREDPYTTVLLDAVGILRRLKEDFAYLGEGEPCCGSPLYYLGFLEDFAGKAEEAFRRFKEAGVREIVGIVPACTSSLKNLHPKFVDGYDLEVKHFVEYLDEVFDRKPVKLRLDKTVTIHDPCQIARFLEISDVLRRLLSKVEGLTVLEVPTSREFTMCCGGGTGLEFTLPELSLKIAAKRVRELLETGASTIVTCCPGCLMQLRHGAEAVGAEVEILDVVQLLSQALEG